MLDIATWLISTRTPATKRRATRSAEVVNGAAVATVAKRTWDRPMVTSADVVNVERTNDVRSNERSTRGSLSGDVALTGRCAPFFFAVADLSTA
jgi:hypothetical protein